MAFPCPRCGDRYTQSLPMAYGSGTYVRNWRSRSGYRGSTVSQSLVGSLASPPIKRSLWKPLVCVFLAALWFTPAFVVAWEQWVIGTAPHATAPILNGTQGHHAKPIPVRPVPTTADHVESLLIILALGVTLESLIVWWLVRNIRFNRLAYPGLLRSWQLSFMCRQCGTVFYPPDAANIVIAPVL